MMKQLYLIAVVFAAILLAGNAYAEGNIKIGVDLAGSHEVTWNGLNGDEVVETGISLSGEYMQAINSNIRLGGGITFQIPRSQEDYAGDFNFIPLYGLLKIYTNSQEQDEENIQVQKTNYYVLGHLGYNLFRGDDDYKGDEYLTGGIYYGIGGGIVFNKNNQLELLYSINNGSIDDLNVDVEYSKITISYGYVF
ncbi:MAG: hypothetical protein PHD29_09435 [bacterium]|nr:hypothetical protein [bacterium]MDD5757268.1 hypothetical protein [bacterium]